MGNSGSRTSHTIRLSKRSRRLRNAPSVRQTLLAISCLIYLGRCRSPFDNRTGWNRSTLAGMQEEAEPLRTGKRDRLASNDDASPQGI